MANMQTRKFLRLFGKDNLSVSSLTVRAKHGAKNKYFAQMSYGGQSNFHGITQL